MKQLLWLGILLVCIGSATAQSLESYSVDFTAVLGKVVVDSSLEFKEPFSGTFITETPGDAAGSTVYVNGELTNMRIEDGRLELPLESADSINFNYVTKDPLDGSNFIVNLVMPYDSEMLSVRLTLPEDAVLAKTSSTASVSGSAAFPKPTRITSDGRSIILEWEKENLKKEDEFSIYVKYEKTGNASLIIFLFVLVILMVGAVVLVALKKARVKTVIKTRVVRSKEGIEEHLKEDEEQVVNILKQRENQCEQGTLRVITGFSKAKLSGLLKELEDRKVIHKEKRGKKNLVFLRYR